MEEKPNEKQPSEEKKSSVVTVSQEQLNNQDENTPPPEVETKGPSKFLRVFTSSLLIGTGLVGGFFIGAVINFGACWKSECSAFEEGAAIYIPAASLLITVPIAAKINQKK